MPSTRCAALTALYVLSLAGTMLLLVAACLDDATVSLALITAATTLIAATCRLAALNYFRTDRSLP